MRNIWKWLVGILLGVVVIGALAAVAFMWRSHVPAFSGSPVQPRYGWNNGPAPRGDGFGWERGPIMRRGRGFRLFRGVFFLGRLLGVVLLGVLLYAAYWLGRRNARVVMDQRPPAVTPPAANPPPDENIPASS